jgi:hypothetical protein
VKRLEILRLTAGVFYVFIIAVKRFNKKSPHHIISDFMRVPVMDGSEIPVEEVQSRSQRRKASDADSKVQVSRSALKVDYYFGR